MALSITHAFVSSKADGPDATFVKPSNWNAALTTSMATAKILGRATAGTGAIEELNVAVNAAGDMSISSTTTSGSAITGALIIAGGLGTLDNINATGYINGGDFRLNGFPVVHDSGGF